MKKSAWARWMVVARRAAEIQAHVLFFLLYFLALVPLGLLQPVSRRALTRRTTGKPTWHAREGPHPTELTSSRRQY
jgi:hypothetical protein